MNIFTVCLFILLFCNINIYTQAKTHYLTPNQHIEHDPVSLPYDKRKELQIYCYEGRPKYIIHVWQSVSVVLVHKTDNFVQYDGHDPAEVLQKYDARRSSWSFSLFSSKQKHYTLNPFNQSCIGIESTEKYAVHLHVIRIDYWKIILLVAGLVLFLSAPKISNNPIFYYLCGISLGVSASFLILIYLVSKLIPKRPMMYGFVIGGWTVGVYLLQILWENFRVIATTYRSYVLWYAFITGFISFVICYRVGPVNNPRSRNLIRWTLQTLGLVTIFHSSDFQEAAMGIIVLLLLGYNVPRSWISKSRTYWKRKFPPKVRLLTNDEYYQEGVKQTEKALKELRVYCSSPNCNQWKTVLTLQNAKRFASFVEGTSHLSDEEILDYENESFHRMELTDEEEMTDDSEMLSD